MAKTAPTPQERGDQIFVERGDHFVARGDRRVQVEAIHLDDGVPRVTAVELTCSTCDRPVLHAVSMCGCTPTWSPEGETFTVVLTYRTMRGWCMPDHYRAVPPT